MVSIEKKFRPLRERVYHKYLRLTAGQRCLPDFLVIGGQKCGTTSLYDYLTQHPQILPAAKKGVHYFDFYHAQGPLWYRSHFPLQRKKQAGHITGEASPYYVVHPQVPERIAQLVPNVKLIVLLRDPVTRAISHYFHEYRRGKETLSLEEALAGEEERIQPEFQQLLIDDAYRSSAFQTYSYKKRGVYYEQLSRYAESFPKERMHVIRSEDFFRRPTPVLQAVFRFLGVNDTYVPHDLTPKNIGDYAGKVSPKTIAALREYFAPHNRRLYAWLGRDLGWDRQG